MDRLLLNGECTDELNQGNLAPLIGTLGWIEAAIAIKIMIARFLVQKFIVGKIHWSDWLMLFALGLNAMKWSYVAQPAGIMSPTFSRIAFCIYMLKFVGTGRLMRNLFCIIVVTQLIVNLGTMVEILISCDKFAQLWDHSLQGRCWSPKIQAYTGFFQGAWNSTTDLILTILPILILKNLNMELRTRIALCIILGLSFFAMIACIVKTVELKALGDRFDFTYNTANFVIWFTVEQYIVIIAASIPTIRPLALRISQRWRNRTPVGSVPTVDRPTRRTAAPNSGGPINLSWSSVTQPRPVRLNTPTVDDAMQKVELEPPYIHPAPRSPPPPGTIRKTISVVIKSESIDENLNQTQGVQTTISAGPITPEPSTVATKHESWPFPAEFKDK